MKLTDNLLKRFGTDKILHHVTGSSVCALISLVAIIQDGIIGWDILTYPVIGDVAVFLVSTVKEYIDARFDWKDILAAMLGCIWVFMAVAAGVFLYQLSV